MLMNENSAIYAPINNKTLSCDIPLRVQELSLSFVMYPYVVEESVKTYKVYSPRSNLFLRKNMDYTTYSNLPTSAKKLTYFTIHDGLLAGVQNMFREGDILFDKLLNNITVSKDGKVGFATDLIKLHASFLNEYGGVQTALKLVPVPRITNDGRSAPSMGLYINMMDNVAMLYEQEYRRLSTFIQKFDFMEFEHRLLMQYTHAKVTKNVLSKETIDARKKEYQFR